jgi:hypothetical protein
VLYADPSINPAVASSQDILASGGVFLAGGAQLLHSTAPDVSQTPTNASVAVRDVAGVLTIIQRITEHRVVAEWWETVAGLDRVIEWNVFTAGSPDDALSLAQMAQQFERSG